MPWDAIVVGAGPAGATAARVIAEGGAKVLLLDRRAFPREKPCGGSVSAPAFPLLPGPVPPSIPWVPIDGAELRWHRCWTVGIDAPGAGGVVRRTDFDAWLLDAAVRAGAEFRPGVVPEALERAGEGIRLRVRGEWMTARRLIGCDGAASWTARRLGARPRATAWGLETTVPAMVVARPVFDFSFGERGYAWAFPRPGGTSAGVYSMDRAGIRRALDLFWGTLGQGPLPAPARLWMAPLGVDPVEGWDGRVLLAGDAAGAVDPYLGEGIRYALLTGKRAAESMLGDGGYAAWFARELAPEFRAAGRMQTLFHALSPALLERLLAHPRVREGFTAILAGRRSYRGSLGALKRLPSLLDPRST